MYKRQREAVEAASAVPQAPAPNTAILMTALIELESPEPFEFPSGDDTCNAQVQGPSTSNERGLPEPFELPSGDDTCNARV